MCVLCESVPRPKVIQGHHVFPMCVCGVISAPLPPAKGSLHGIVSLIIALKSAATAMFEIMTYFSPLVWEMMDSRLSFLSFLLNYRFRCRRYTTMLLIVQSWTSGGQNSIKFYSIHLTVWKKGKADT